MFKFSIKDYEKELKKELEMRQKVWIKYNNAKFADPEKQTRYEVLAELAELLKWAPMVVFESMRKQAESAAGIVQSTMDFGE